MSANKNENVKGVLSGDVASDCDEHSDDAPHHQSVTASGNDKQPSLGTNRFAILSSSTVRKGNLLKSPIARDLCKLTERMVVSMNGQNTQTSTIVNARDVDEDAAGEDRDRKKIKKTKAMSSKESRTETEAAPKVATDSHGHDDNECESNGGDQTLLLHDVSDGDSGDDDELNLKERNSKHHHHRHADLKTQSGVCGTNLSDERLIRIEKQFAGGKKAAARYAAKNCSQKHSGLLVSNSHQELQHRYTHLLVTDFEATCDSAEPDYPHEIIEFPCVAVDLSTLKVVDEFGTFVKPTKNPILSEFCTELTTIKQKDVDTAPTIVEALSMFNSWLENLRKKYEQIDATVDVQQTTALQDRDHDAEEPSSAIPTTTTTASPTRRFNPVFATDGPWDMRKFMHECHVIRDGIAFPELFYRWIDVRRCFSDFFHKQLFKLTKMLRALGMNFVGERHRGIDDSRNIARVAIALAKRGYKFRQPASIPYRDETSPILAHERSALALLKEIEEEDAAKKKKKNNKPSCPTKRKGK